jgi:hypothetical protein
MAFDIREQTDRSSAVTPDSIDFDAFAARPMSTHTVRCLRFLCDVERHTIRHLRDVLVTPSHTDPVVTEFLTGWAFQEFWLAESLDAVIARHPPANAHPPPPRLRIAQELRDRFAPVRQSLLANLIGEDFVAIHMTWAYVDAWVTGTAYERVAAHQHHPELTALIERIRTVKVLHRDFYADQALRRLSGSRRARMLTRQALSLVWRPPGASIHAKAETRFVLHYLFDAHDSRRFDAKLDSLPGLDGLRIVSSAMATFGVIPPITDGTVRP